jgi:glycosyltransferase involved in cell wall biosynthesis
MLHYTAPPVVGGVEAVIQAHARVLVAAGYPVTVVAGWGEASALPSGATLIRVPEMDSQYRQIAEISAHLEQGEVPPDFEVMVDRLVEALGPALALCENVIVHNVFTKHFNLPLTAAMNRLLDDGSIRQCLAWCHDFTWTSPNSRSKVHPGYPWDLLRTYRDDVTYVTVSQRRQQELADLFGCPLEKVHVVYNGVDPQELLGLSDEGAALVDRLALLESDLVLLMPVRVTQAKNIEHALDVVSALKTLDLNPKLILTGPPDPHDAASMAYFQELRALRGQLGVEDAMRFVFESGPHPDQPYTIGPRVVGDLFRVSDVVFMPSHREGFAMPILEAGLSGVPVASTGVPAAVEIGGQDVLLFDLADEPELVAGRLWKWLQEQPTYHLRRRVRQGYTWEAIFRRDMKPLLGMP